MAQPPATIDSVHRYPSRSLRSSEALALLYWTWLDRAWGPVVRVGVQPEGVQIRTLGLAAIELRTQEAGDYAVQGGMLARPGGRFVFASSEEVAEAALLGFHPSLPVWLYRLTHGAVHEWTMRRFGRHLARIDGHLEEPLP